MNDIKNTCFRDFTKYSSFSIFGMLGVSCYILADTFFVSTDMGTNGLAALNLALPVYNFIHGTGLMLGMGAATKFTIFKSNEDHKNGDRVFTNTMYIALIFSLLFTLAGIFLSEGIAVFLGADTGVLARTDTYLKWLLIFAPAFILNDVLICFIRNDKSPLLSMSAMLASSFSNIILDYIFIFPLKMDIFGAVFATGLSAIISITMMSPHLLRRKNSFHLTKTGLDIRTTLNTFSIGLPDLISQLSTGIVMIIFNILILRLEGNVGVAAYGIIANIALVVAAVHTGISQGIQPLISAAYGSGRRADIRRLLKYSMTAMLIISVAIYGAIFFFAEPISAVFNSEKDITLEKIAVTGLRLYFTAMVFNGFNIIISVFFTATDHPLPAHISSILRGLILIIPTALILSALFKMAGIWLASPVTEFLVSLLGLYMYRRYRKKLYWN